MNTTMKYNISLIAAMAALCFAGPGTAADFLSVAGSRAKVIAENDKFRIMDVQLKKGDKIPMHTHPESIVYVIKTGKVRWTSEDGKVTETTGKDGEALIRPPVTHAHEHLEDSHAILIEMKK